MKGAEGKLKGKDGQEEEKEVDPQSRLVYFLKKRIPANPMEILSDRIPAYVRIPVKGHVAPMGGLSSRADEAAR